MHQITVKFPRSNTCRLIKNVPSEIRRRFPVSKPQYSVLEVSLENEARVIVEGYGMPYAHKGHIAEKWLHQNQPIVHDVTLLGLLEQRSFHFVVNSRPDVLREIWDPALLPQPFRYPYAFGKDHAWKGPEVYYEMLQKAKGHRFDARLSFDSSNEMLTVLSQSQIQDIMWLAGAAEKIRSAVHSAYFIPIGYNTPQLYYAIVALSKGFRDAHHAAWDQLSKNDTLKIDLHQDSENKGSEVWDAAIMDPSLTVYTLNAHPVEKNELLLLVQRPNSTEETRDSVFRVKTYSDRTAANADFEFSKER